MKSSKVYKLDIDKLVPVPVYCSAVKNDVVKKDAYNAKIKNIEDKIPDITNLTTTTDLNAKINVFKNKITSITNLATATALNAKINEVNNKIPNITNLATTTALAAVENKIPNVNNLGEKKHKKYNTKICEIENNVATDHDHDRYITTKEINKLTSEHFTARLAQANLASKSNNAIFVKKTDLNKNKLNELSKKLKQYQQKY